MDPALLIGAVLAFGALVGMMTIEHVSITSIFLPGPLLLVFGTTLGVGIASGALKDAINSFKIILPSILAKKANPAKSIEELVSISEKARANGLLALEQEAEGVDDPFLKGALQSVADGTDADELRELLEDEIQGRTAQARQGAKFFMSMGGYAPTVGIIGTVVSLTHVLENLSSPDELGPLIASAFIATLWGLISANLMWLPLAGRVKRMMELEVTRMTLLMEGVLAIQEGTQPRLLGARLRAMVPKVDLPAEGKTVKSTKVGDKEDIAA
ncbi:motility protein A [Frondihabitans sp. Leaf304]|uniref:motility protein A n=1 Tax=Frondihabitans sp. Leaf304 TaxID=1736329 RepID=UPI0006FF2D7B|nr:MotA/TolQ/ExbB proton channel family protein [Frondihabitans sp. Leaf304]KQQ25687.1 flagellar motor protein MotA [Frondihabitans sp. Leaf304]